MFIINQEEERAKSVMDDGQKFVTSTFYKKSLSTRGGPKSIAPMRNVPKICETNSPSPHFD